jgi:glucans biosynthesis protein C
MDTTAPNLGLAIAPGALGPSLVSEAPSPEVPSRNEGRQKEKELAIETLRAIAIVLMVAGHVIGMDSRSGLQVADDSLLRFLYRACAYIRMPLFTAISGYVYALRPVRRGQEGSLLKGKVRRILLPMVTIGTLQYLARVASLPGTNRNAELQDIWRIYVYGFDQFWFLQAIFLAFVLIVALERFALLSTPRRWLGVLVVLFALRVYLPYITSLFSLPGFLTIVPYFVLGLGAYRFSKLVFNAWVVALSMVAFIAAYSVNLIVISQLDQMTSIENGLLSVAVGLPAIVLFFYARWPSPLLAWLGSYAYTIFLFHVFGSAGARILVRRFVAEPSIWLQFGLSLVAGLLLPIAMESGLRRNNFTRRWLLGLR